jgi:hypothetical protein
MKVHYSGGRSVVVKGPATGAEYRFSGLDRVQLVDPRDAVQIARNLLFRVEGVVELPITELSAPKRDGITNG